jgi:hypothetical protein
METENEMKFHELANVFPLMEGAEFAELVASVRARGQMEAIVIFEGQILDGRNRARACQAAGLERVESEEFEGTFAQAREFVISANITRRHLDPSQRAMIAAKLATIGHGGDRRSDQAANLPVETQAEAAERLNVSERSVRDARKVLDKGAPELVAAVERREVPVSRAAKIAELPKAEQPRRMSEPLEPRPASRLSVAPLRTFENLAAGELVRWLRMHDWSRLPRMLRMAADLIDEELKNGRAA